MQTLYTIVYSLVIEFPTLLQSEFKTRNSVTKAKTRIVGKKIQLKLNNKHMFFEWKTLSTDFYTDLSFLHTDFSNK